MGTKRLRVIAPHVPVSPRPLGEHGSALWCSIHRDYQITDPVRLMMLQEICEATDRAQDCAAQVAKDGCVIRTKTGELKDHPALRAELQNRAFIVRTMQRLLADIEEPKRVGRPPMPVGWLGPESER